MCWRLWTSGQVIQIVPKVFPDPPASYNEIERIKSSKTWAVPEDGYFQIDAISKSGDGGKAKRYTSDRIYYGNGPSGGSGAVTRKSLIKLNKGDSVKISISSSSTRVEIPSAGIELEVSAGTNGKDRPSDGQGAHGGSAGYVRKKGDKSYDGENGIYAGSQAGTPGDGNISGSSSVSTTNPWYSVYSGKGGGFANFEEVPPGKGSAAMVVIFRGNTNLSLSKINAQEITDLMLEMNQLSQNQTQIMLDSVRLS